MRIDFVPTRPNGPARLLAEAEILFDEAPLAGTKLVGISLWEGSEPDVIVVTFPARSFGAGGERRFFDFLRNAETGSTATKGVKDWILAEYRKAQAAA